MKVDVVVIRGCDDEFICLDVALFNDLNVVDHCSVSYDEELFDEFVLCFLV